MASAEFDSLFHEMQYSKDTINCHVFQVIYLGDIPSVLPAVQNDVMQAHEILVTRL